MRNYFKFITIHFISMVAPVGLYIVFKQQILSPSVGILYAFIIFYTFFKSFYFVLVSIEQLFEANKVHIKSQYSFYISRFSIVLLYITISFAIDMWLVYQLNNENYLNVAGENVYLQFFDFLNYSLMIITTAGFTEIKAMTIISKFLTAFEVIIGVVLLVYILSGYSVLKEGYLEKKDK